MDVQAKGLGLRAKGREQRARIRSLFFETFKAFETFETFLSFQF